MYYDLDKPVNVKMFGKYTQSQGFWHNGRILKENVFFYLVDGKLDMKIDDTIYHTSAGDVLLIPSSTFYQPLDSDGCSYYYLHFTACLTTEDASYNSQSKIAEFDEQKLEDGYMYNYYEQGISNPIVKVPIHTKGGNKITEVFSRATKLNIWRNYSEKLLLDNIARELLIVLSIILENEQSVNHTLQKILLYIKKHYTEPITLSSISEEFDISTSYTLKLFKKNLGVGTVDYINTFRLSRACEYLLSSDYTIGEISNKVGFANQYYFDRLFRKKYGMTPTEFRKSNYMMRP